MIQQTESISRNIDIKRQNITKMAATAISLKERAAEFNISTDMADSRTAYAISLYAKISNITWDYSLTEGKLGGCKRHYFLLCYNKAMTFIWKNVNHAAVEFL